MGTRAALLDPADLQGRRSEVHLIPAQVRHLACPQAVPVGHQDHCGVTVGPAVCLGSFQQSLDLGFREVLAGAQIGIGTAPGGADCSFFGGRRDETEAGFGQGFRPSAVTTVRIIVHLRTVDK